MATSSRILTSLRWGGRALRAGAYVTVAWALAECLTVSLGLAQESEPPGPAATMPTVDARSAELDATAGAMRVEFDGGRGTVWLATGSRARRVADSLVLFEGSALWAHPDAAATLTVGDRDIRLDHGGVVGLRVGDAPGFSIVDLYAGRGLATVGRTEKRVHAGHSVRGSAPNPELDAVPPLTLTYGPDVVEPNTAARVDRPAGLGGVLLLAVSGDSQPTPLDPDAIELEVTLSTLSARVSMTLSYVAPPAAPGAPCCEGQLAVFHGLLPAEAILHDIAIDVDGERYAADVVDDPAPGALRSMSSNIEPEDELAPLVARLPLGMYPVVPGAPVRVQLDWTQPLSLGSDLALMLLPAPGQAYGRQASTLTVTVTGEPHVDLSLLQANLPLVPSDGAWTVTLTDAALEPGLALGLPRPAAGVWAGRAPGVDGIAFALVEPVRRAQAEGIEMIFLVDESASIGVAQRRHAREAIAALVGSLNPARDRVGLLRFGTGVERGSAGMRAPNLDAIDAFDASLSSAPVGGATDMGSALWAAVHLARSEGSERPIQLVYLGDAEPTLTSATDLDAALGALVELRVSTLVVEIVEGRSRGDLEHLQRRWQVPRLRVVPTSSGSITAARCLPLLGVELSRRQDRFSDSSAVDELVQAMAPAGWDTHVGLTFGHFLGPRPIFDLPGSFGVCTSGAACESPTEVDLAQASPAAGAAVLHAAAKLWVRAGTNQVATRYADDPGEQLRVYGADRALAVTELRGAFELEFLRRRSYGAPETRWIRYDRTLTAPDAGRVTERAAPASAPEPSDPHGNGSAVLNMSLGRDPYLRSTPPSTPQPPTIDEVLSGQRGTTTTPGVPGSPHAYDSVPYIIENFVNYQVDQALTVAREAAYGQVRGDAAKAEAFVTAWHEVSLRSMNQLYIVQNHYYELSLYDKAALVGYDLMAIDPYEYGTVRQKEALRHFLDQKLWSRAEPLLRQGRVIHPEDEFYAEGLTRLLEATGRKDELAELQSENLARLLETRPDDQGAIELAVTRLVEAGKADAARRAINHWTERIGASPTACALRARLEVLARRPEEGIRHLERCLETFPSSRLARVQLIDALLDAGRRDAALAYAEKWLSQDPSNTYLMQFIGDAYFVRGDFAAATALYYAIIEHAPEQAVGYVKLGDVEAAQGNAEAATKAFGAALAIQPGHLATHLRMAEAATLAGDFERALEAFKAMRSAGSGAVYDEATRARDETFYQLLTHWHASAIAVGDDTLADRVEQELSTVHVDGGLYTNYGQQAYAMRLAFVPESDDPDLLLDFRVVEPGGNIVSYIMPYNSALGSQLFATSKSGPGPRVYTVPSVETGTFEVAVTFEGPAQHGPVRGQLYVHRMPKPFVEQWDRYPVVLQRVGDQVTTKVSFDAPTP